MIPKLSVCTLAFVSLLAASPASAVTTTFEFLSDGDDDQSSLSFSQDGIDLTVEGFTTPRATGVSSATNIVQTAHGLGVATSPDSINVGTSGNNSPDEINESLKFSFTPDVTFLSGFVIETSTKTEFFDVLRADGSVIESFQFSGPGQSIFEFELAAPEVGSMFSIRHEKGRGILVRSITVQAIPGPLGIVGLVSAFALAAGVAARRKAAA